MKNTVHIFLTAFLLSLPIVTRAEEPQGQGSPVEHINILDDKLLLEDYSQRYRDQPKEILLAMIKDDSLNPIKMAAAVRVLNKNYCQQVFFREKNAIEKVLLHRLSRTDSPYMQIEISHALCRLDRFKYFNSMVPALLLKLEHYNNAVNELAYDAVDDIINGRNNRTREARIVFNTLRKTLFLSRRRLAEVTQPDPKLKRKLKLVRWSIKVLGNQELRRLPKEVINLL